VKAKEDYNVEKIFKSAKSMLKVAQVNLRAAGHSGIGFWGVKTASWVLRTNGWGLGVETASWVLRMNGWGLLGVETAGWG